MVRTVHIIKEKGRTRTNKIKPNDLYDIGMHCLKQLIHHENQIKLKQISFFIQLSDAWVRPKLRARKSEEKMK